MYAYMYIHTSKYVCKPYNYIHTYTFACIHIGMDSRVEAHGEGCIILMSCIHSHVYTCAYD